MRRAAIFRRTSWAGRVARGVGLVLVLCGSAVPPRAAPPPAALDEQVLKSVVAAYLEKFASYVRWPDNDPRPGTPFTIAILGKDPLGKLLDRLLADKKAAGHPLRVVRANGVEELAGCQMVFMDQPTEERACEVAEALRGRPVLLVAFEPEGGRSAAAVEVVVLEDGTVRYRLSVDALRRAGLSASPGLLQNSFTGERAAVSPPPKSTAR